MLFRSRTEREELLILTLVGLSGDASSVLRLVSSFLPWFSAVDDVPALSWHAKGFNIKSLDKMREGRSSRGEEKAMSK